MTKLEQNLMTIFNSILSEHYILITYENEIFKLVSALFMKTLISYNSLKDLFITDKQNIFNIIDTYSHYHRYYRFNNFPELIKKIYGLKGDTLEEIMIKLQINGY